MTKENGGTGRSQALPFMQSQAPSGHQSMRLVIELSVGLPSISETLSILTDRARIHLADIQYHEPHKTVEILMQRSELIGVKESFHGMRKPVYGHNVLKTLLVVKDVIGMNMETQDQILTQEGSWFTVLFGVNLSSHTLYLGSAEESGGKNLCQVTIELERTNIEFLDVEN